MLLRQNVAHQPVSSVWKPQGGDLMGFPLAHTVEVASPVGTAKDRFSNEIPAPAEFVSLKVAGWAINSTSESDDESVLRTIDYLDLYSPEALDPAALVRLPDGSTWTVEGKAQDFNHGPWWQPGLYIIRCKHVEG